MLCGNLAIIDGRHPNRSQIKSVTALPYVVRLWNSVIREEKCGLLKFKHVFMAALI